MLTFSNSSQFVIEKKKHSRGALLLVMPVYRCLLFIFVLHVSLLFFNVYALKISNQNYSGLLCLSNLTKSV